MDCSECDQMKLIMIGGFFGEDYELLIKSDSKNTFIQYSANTFQKSIVNVFLEMGLSPTLISAPFVGHYPIESRRLLIKPRMGLFNGITSTYVGFNNLWGWRNRSRANSLSNELSKIDNPGCDAIIIFVYSAHTPFLKAAEKYKSQNKNVHVVLMVNDLPQYMNLRKNKSLLYTICKKIDIFQFMRAVKCVDAFIFITEQMAEVFRAKNYIVIEAIANPDKECNQTTPLAEYGDYALYTGNLNEVFGIKQLANVFINTDLPIKLVIAGGGDCETYILQLCKTSSKIIYLGQVSHSYSKVLQSSAKFLINPRRGDGLYTRYSFPFKIIEYLETGVPIFCYRLLGVPAQYDRYLNYLDESDPNSLELNLKTAILEYKDYKSRALDGREFVLKFKTAEYWAIQLKKFFLNIR